jgi:hypothetical protein
MSDLLPGINYTVRQSLTRLAYQSNVYSDEFVQQMLLAIGHPD